MVTPSGNNNQFTGVSLSTNMGSWTPVCQPINSYSYQWYRGSTAIPGSQGGTSSSYTTKTADINSTLTVKVTACDTLHNCNTVTSTGSDFVVPAPANTSGPTISGTASNGSTLTASDSWNGYGLADTISRQWQDCGYEGTILNNGNGTVTGPLGYWRLGDSSGVAPTARDEMELNDGTYVDGPTLGVTGALNSDSNTAATFSSSSAQYVNLANTVQFDSGPFTIEAWAKTSSSSQTQTIWDSGNNGSNPGQVIELRFSTAGQVQLFVENASGTSLLLQSGSTWNNGAWHHIVATRSVSGGNDTFTLYVDGTQVNTATGASYGDLDAAGAPARIGNGVGPRDGFWFNGSIDDVAVYDFALSSSQVAYDHNAGVNVTNSCVNLPGEAGTTYVPGVPGQTYNDFGDKIRYSVFASNNDGTSSTLYSSLTSAVTDTVPSGTPTPSGTVNTLTPELQGSADSDGDWVDTQFEISSSTQPGFTPIYSGWQLGTNTWIVPAGDLQNGYQYTFITQSRDPYQDTSWSSGTTFTVNLPNYGSRGYWPMWSHGPVSVNEANGNLVLSLPTPSYPTATGSLGFSLTYNSQSTNTSPGLGTGWLLGGGDDSITPPVKLIDHNIATPKQAAAEIVWPDGSSDFYNRVGPSTQNGDITYIGGPGDSNHLIEYIDPTGSHNKTWTLTDGSGNTYTFATEDNTTGIAYLASAEAATTPVSSGNNGTLTYTFATTGTPGELQDVQYTLSSSLNEDLHFTYNCTYAGSVTAELCVQFEVNGIPVSGQEWAYVGATGSGSSGEIVQVYDPRWQIMQLTDNTNGQPTEIQNANDLHSGSASPGYNSAHNVQLTYDASSPARVTCLIDGPISSQAASTQPSCAGGGSASDSTWSFIYTNACPTLKAPAATHSLAQGTAVGCTTVINPDQQPSTTSGVTVLYDSQGRPLEYLDNRLSTTSPRITLQQYNKADQVAWSEDQDGNPTDYAYDLVDNVLDTVTAPSPGGSSPRPVTTYRYDEQAIGTTGTAGPALTGLAGLYWDQSLNLGPGLPSVRENDPSPTDSTTTTFSFGSGSGQASWPSGVGPSTHNFSVRWTGDITLPATTSYKFTAVTDGETRVEIDGNPLIDSWQFPGGATGAPVSKPITLTAGKHSIVIEYAHEYRVTGPGGGTVVAPTFTLEWNCSGCGSGNPAVPRSDLAPAWENQTSIVSPAGRIGFRHFLYPASAKPDYSVAQVGSQNLITSFSYDSLGRLASKLTPMANTNATLASATGDITPNYGSNYQDWETDYTYYSDTATPTIPSDCGGGTAPNQLGQLESTSVPNAGLAAITTVYNALGSPIATTNGKGASCVWYDGLAYGIESEGLLTQQTPHGDQAHPTTYSYDPNGAERTATSANGTVTNSYDEAGRLTDTVDAYGAEAAYSYDGDGDLLKRNAAAGALNSNTNYDTLYSYDNADELSSETDPADNTYHFYYDNRGNLRGTQYPTGTPNYPSGTPTFSWVDTNPDGWISDQYNRHGTISSTTTTAPSDSSPLADFTYTYDQDGKKLSQTELSGSTSSSTTYNYDNAGRLTQVLLPSGTCRNYIYDLDSNRTQIEESPTGCSGTFSTTANYTYDPTTTQGTDQLTSITAGGNTTSYGYTTDGQVSTQGAGTTYTWDGFGRLSAATVGSNTVTYTYDPTGALIARTSTSPSSSTQYRLGGLFETDGTGTITTSYADGPAGDLATFTGAPTSSSAVSFLYYDAHGNLAAEADDTGTLTATHTYDPFGAPTDSTPSNQIVHRFTGRWNKQYDTTTNLILMGARPYDPNTGRFLAVDPVPGGSLNNYDYAGQDPINNYDLAGTELNGSEDGFVIASEFSPEPELGSEHTIESESESEYGHLVQEGEFGVPEDVEKSYRELKENNFPDREGFRDSHPFKNLERGLPEGEYRTYDVNPTPEGERADGWRIVVNVNTGEAYWTSDHYGSFYYIPGSGG